MKGQSLAKSCGKFILEIWNLHFITTYYLILVHKIDVGDVTIRSSEAEFVPYVVTDGV